MKGVGEIGIPSDDDMDSGHTMLAGWEEKVSGWLTPERNRADYEYDFGDGWQHSVILEQVLTREKGVKYPRCIDGKRACPPEDCGGVHGYMEVCKGKFKEHYRGYEPERWDPAFVRFTDPKRRLKRLLDSMSAH